MDGHLWPLGLYFLAVLAIVAGMIGISALLGERHRERTTTSRLNPALPRPVQHSFVCRFSFT